jgi:general stress protein 26
MTSEPTPELDTRFSHPDAAATPWSATAAVLGRAELYWITTVRADGRPHVTPLVGVVEGDALHFCTGLEEQKARNLEHNRHVAMTTGNNTWAAGLDVVVEGSAVRVTDPDALQRLADAYEAKYGSAWQFDVGDGVLTHGERGELEAAAFRVEPAKVLAFAKDPHAHTRYRFRNGG